MRILMYVTQSRVIMPALASIHEIDVAGHEVTLVFDRTQNANPGHRHRYDIHCLKVNRARNMALEGKYEALFSLDDDMLIPPMALHDLLAVGADVAYGLAVWRNAPHQWTAVLSLKWGDIDTLDLHPDSARRLWGVPLETMGCGFHCTLIRRPVLEEIAFYRDGPGAADWGLAFDAREKGFTQVTHTGVVCGHCEPITDEIYWPDIDAPQLWRAEKLSEYKQEAVHADRI
jgi:hypothetical protein